tara:strand:+ start:81 stop:290 length:210 start_codon:yes stop_codon:yes gene_type:complete
MGSSASVVTFKQIPHLDELLKMILHLLKINLLIYMRKKTYMKRKRKQRKKKKEKRRKDTMMMKILKKMK